MGSVVPGVTYYYYVVAVKAYASDAIVNEDESFTISGSKSKLSNPVVYTSKAPLSAPKSFKVTSKKAGKVELSWKRDTKAVGYKVYRSTKKNGTYKVVALCESESMTLIEGKATAAKKIKAK